MGYAERLPLIQAKIPELFGQAGTVLYIGANTKWFHLGRQLHQARHEVTVVEVWQPYIDELQESPLRKLMAHLVQGDVREIDGVALPHDVFDWVIWNHGPEHVACEELKPTVGKLEALAGRAVIMGCPWGIVRHGCYHGNIYARHLCFLYPADFEELGYEAACIEPMDKPGGHILAWKFM
jgi:hypothetical protein